MTDSDKIRYRPDGSIDTGFYMAQGRALRSGKVHELLGRTPKDNRRAPKLLPVPLFG